MNESRQTRRMYGHDYAVPGTYEVTIVVADRRPVFGEIAGTTKNDGEKPHLKPHWHTTNVAVQGFRPACSQWLMNCDLITRNLNKKE